ncbi:hypothetical protein PIB30_065121 [Stylosanthes scabra]|uniref:Uncharacterized protein n=1 Tax=Stylosanthes scabra TaxID=79078 RepID=A0ABU6RMA5_9FABA|nr:hypothetical protein [Stylosanthes scabra]
MWTMGNQVRLATKKEERLNKYFRQEGEDLKSKRIVTNLEAEERKQGRNKKSEGLQGDVGDIFGIVVLYPCSYVFLMVMSKRRRKDSASHLRVKTSK